jgi:hypothetical protein
MGERSDEFGNPKRKRGFSNSLLAYASGYELPGLMHCRTKAVPSQSRKSRDNQITHWLNCRNHPQRKLQRNVDIPTDIDMLNERELPDFPGWKSSLSTTKITPTRPSGKQLSHQTSR